MIRYQDVTVYLISLLEDGHVAEVDTCIEVKDSYEVIDAKGKYIMPGFVDLHEHFREPGYTYKETVKTDYGSRKRWIYFCILYA